MSWVAITTVSVMSFISPRVRMISLRVAMSRLAVGSSSSKMPGFSATPMARLARRICPPESSRPSRSCSAVSRNRASSSSVRSLQCVHAPGLHGKGDVRPDGVLDEHLLRVLVHQGNLPGQVLCLFPRGCSPRSGGCPRRRASKAPPSASSSVDFPAPLEPISATLSPLRIVRSSPSNTTRCAPFTDAVR